MKRHPRTLVRIAVAGLLFLPALSAAQSSTPIYGVGTTDVGPTIGLGGIGEAGLAFGGRFERGIKKLEDLGGGVLGIQASVDIWNYNQVFGTAYDFRYLNIGVTANYHFAVKSNPKIDPFLGLGLGNSSISTDYAGSLSSGVYFVGRAGIRYFYKPKLALYADTGTGSSTLNVGVMFGLSGAK